MKIQTINQICKHRHSPHAMCRKTTEPSRCRTCPAATACSPYSKLMFSSVQCQEKRAQVRGQP
jgi:hypothetical protein